MSVGCSILYVNGNSTYPEKCLKGWMPSIREYIICYGEALVEKSNISVDHGNWRYYESGMCILQTVIFQQMWLSLKIGISHILSYSIDVLCISRQWQVLEKVIYHSKWHIWMANVFFIYIVPANSLSCCRVQQSTPKKTYNLMSLPVT